MGDFWLNYVARKSWAFDMIYWSKIDRRFFGDGNLEDRLQLLTQEERDNMGPFIERKMKEKEERTYPTDWSAERGMETKTIRITSKSIQHESVRNDENMLRLNIRFWQPTTTATLKISR